MTLALALTVMVALGSSAVASADAVGTAFRAYLTAEYGTTHPQYAECPQIERFENGDAICKAEFKRSGRWRYVDATLRADGSVIRKPYTSTWKRKWRTCKSGDRYAPGKLISNLGYCNRLMAGDVQNSVAFQGKYPKRVGFHGTNWAGFGEIAIFRCTHKGRTVRCENSLGDAFRYTVAD